MRRKVGDWSCPGCGFLNFASRLKCMKCETRKDEIFDEESQQQQQQQPNQNQSAQQQQQQQIQEQQQQQEPKEQKEQSFDYFLVLDFEATCDDDKAFGPQEIIEFPTLLLNSKTLDIEDKFHFYVRPTQRPKLTKFCINLTGITQDKVSQGLPFEEVLQLFDEWLLEKCIKKEASFAFVTCGDWDLKTMLPKQLNLLGEEGRKRASSPPPHFRKWINIKKTFSDLYSSPPKGMPGMLAHLGLELVGRHHSGIDDCGNIAQILVRLIKDGAFLEITNQF